MLFQQALELWRGEPLVDVDLLRGHPEVVRLSRQRAELVLEYARVASSAGWHDRVLDLLRKLAAREPLNEQAHAQLMIALAGCGQQAEALAIYHDLCRRLDSELAVRPSPALTDAHQRVLRQDIAPARGDHAATLDIAVVRSRGAGPVVPKQLPAAPELFVGREAELSALGQLPEAAANAVVISVIGGTAGVGKTTLAVYWAHRVAACFPDGQLYVNLRGFGPSARPVPPSQAVGWFLDALGVAPDGMPVSLEARTGLYRSLVAGKRLLILLDNARDADQVRALLPGSPGCLVLVTCRARLPSLAVSEGAHLLSLDVLTEPEARRMLAGRLGTERVAAEPGAIDELIVLCARLPLALAIIAGCAADRRALPLAALTAGLRDSAGRLDLLDGGDSASSLRAVLSWSYDQLTGSAARMFRLLGLHPGPDITAPAAASLAGTLLADARRALGELTAAGLVAEQPLGRFGFHDLLRVYAREKAAAASPDADCRTALGRALDHYLHTAHAAAVLQYPLRETITLPPLATGVVPEHLETADQALAWFEAEHQVLSSVVDAAGTVALGTRTWRLAWAAAEYFDRKGQFDEQATIARAGLAAAERLGDIAGQAASVRILAHNSARRGNFDRAETELERCMPLYRMLGDSAGEARVQQTFSFVRGRQGRYAEAAAHCERALAIHRALGDRHGEAAALNNLAWNLALVGELNQASELCQRSLHLHRLLGSICEGLSWDTLGFITSGLGRHVEAADCYEHALAVFRRHHHRLYEADTLDHLGDAWDAAGRPRDARDAWQQALHILDDLHHPGARQVFAKLHDSTAPVRA